MYPYINDYFHDKGIENYLILMVAGILAAVICFRIFSSKANLAADTYNFYLLAGVLAIPVGLFSANFFQAVYNYLETGEFELIGMTVMGGILGAAIFFVLFVVIVGETKLGKKHKPQFWTAVNLLIPCIVIAQCLGRIGCFTAGCCYGKETDSPIGVLFIKGYLGDKAVMHEHPRLPTQLFESAFLLTLFVLMLVVMFVLKKKNVTALMYLYLYPIFRFIIEFFRDDERGASLVGLTPSQIQSLLFLGVGIALTVLIYCFKIVPFAGKEKHIRQTTAENKEN